MHRFREELKSELLNIAHGGLHDAAAVPWWVWLMIVLLIAVLASAASAHENLDEKKKQQDSSVNDGKQAPLFQPVDPQRAQTLRGAVAAAAAAEAAAADGVAGTQSMQMSGTQSMPIIGTRGVVGAVPHIHGTQSMMLPGVGGSHVSSSPTLPRGSGTLPPGPMRAMHQATPVLSASSSQLPSPRSPLRGPTSPIRGAVVGSMSGSQVRSNHSTPQHSLVMQHPGHGPVVPQQPPTAVLGAHGAVPRTMSPTSSMHMMPGSASAVAGTASQPGIPRTMSPTKSPVVTTVMPGTGSMSGKSFASMSGHQIPGAAAATTTGGQHFGTWPAIPTAASPSSHMPPTAGTIGMSYPQYGSAAKRSQS